MAKPAQYVIVGVGIAGNKAAGTLREHDPNCRITIITMTSLPYYNRYDLPRVFRGCSDWRELIVHPPAYYEENRIILRRNSQVVNVDGRSRTISFAHNEDMHYDRLLVCTGGRSHLPEGLSEYKHLMNDFTSFEAAMTAFKRLPPGGRVLMLGGDMIGLDLARTLIDTGYQVTLVVSEYTFWPHRVDTEDRANFLKALERMGIEVFDGPPLERVEEGAEGRQTRCLVFEDSSELFGDAVMPFCGLVPSVEFMLGSGVDIERGLLVDLNLRTTDEHIWAAGDVCQIWSAEENAYRFYYGWNNVRVMGEVAARNMAGEDEPFVGSTAETLCINDKGHIDSPLWRHD